MLPDKCSTLFLILASLCNWARAEAKQKNLLKRYNDSVLVEDYNYEGTGKRGHSPSGWQISCFGTRWSIRVGPDWLLLTTEILTTTKQDSSFYDLDNSNHHILKYTKTDCWQKKIRSNQQWYQAGRIKLKLILTVETGNLWILTWYHEYIWYQNSRSICLNFLIRLLVNLLIQ